MAARKSGKNFVEPPLERRGDGHLFRPSTLAANKLR
jgi:hypothetical protein